MGTYFLQWSSNRSAEPELLNIWQNPTIENLAVASSAAMELSPTIPFPFTMRLLPFPGPLACACRVGTRHSAKSYDIKCNAFLLVASPGPGHQPRILRDFSAIAPRNAPNVNPTWLRDVALRCMDRFCVWDFRLASSRCVPNAWTHSFGLFEVKYPAHVSPRIN